VIVTPLARRLTFLGRRRISPCDYYPIPENVKITGGAETNVLWERRGE